MDEDIDILVLAPFREIIEKGRAAAENAKDAAPEMDKAGRNLVKEGERALKRIEPLCKKTVEEYGAAFVDALKDNDEITRLRTELNEMLWDFDSFIEPDDFDADEFAKLQALSRKAAPRIYDVLVRMKLERPPSTTAELGAGARPSFSSAGGSVAASRAASVADPHEAVLSALRRCGTGDGEEGGDREGRGQQPDDPNATTHSHSPRTSIQDVSVVQNSDQGSGSHEGNGDSHIDTSARRPSSMSARPQSLSLEPKARETIPPPSQETPPALRSMDTIRPEDIPPEPPDDPWQTGVRIAPGSTAASVDGIDSGNSSPARRRRVASFVAAGEGAAPTGWNRWRLLAAGGGSGDSNAEGKGWHGGSAQARGLSQSSVGDETAPEFGAGRRRTSTTSNQGAWPNAMPIPTANGARTPSISLVSACILPSSSHVLSSSPSSHTLHPPHAFDGGSSGGGSPELRPRAGYRGSSDSIPERNWLTPDSVQSPAAAPASGDASMRSLQMEQPGLEAVTPQMESGLYPVEARESTPPSPTSPPNHVTREADCTITIDSSFSLFKGFCDGAKEVIRGGAGVKKIRKPGIGAGTVTVAKCKNCMFELDWKLVEADVNMADDANYKQAGINFRLRFLSKSHIASRHIDDQLYGCLFCVRLGRTTEESDATVFFSQRQLFAHLARHPRPLPAVPGLTVVETAAAAAATAGGAGAGGVEVPRHLRNNYDLHFPNPPLPSATLAARRRTSMLPTAVALETIHSGGGGKRAHSGGGGIGIVPSSSGPSSASSRIPPDGLPRLLQLAIGARVVGVEFPERYGGEWAVGWADNVRGAVPAECLRLMPPDQSQIRMQADSNLRAVARWRYRVKEAGPWLRFDKGEVITGISFPFIEHWCWAGYNSKQKWGIFPQSHIEPNTLSEPVQRPAK